MKREINILDFSGGGVKGISYIGVLKCLNELQIKRKQLEEQSDFDNDSCNIPKIDIKHICCVSAGSIIGLFYILGYTFEEMYYEIMNTNLENLRDFRFKNFINKYGLDSGKNIVNWMETLIIKKGYSKDITFKELYDKSGIHYQVLASNLNKYKHTAFDYKKTPNVKITRAIRMSISIPFIFTIEKYNGDIHVDGGLINNYPIKLFEENLENTLGIKLIAKGESNDNVYEEIEDINSYIFHIMKCFMIQKTTLVCKYEPHTICIETETVTHSINFSLTELEKISLIDIGYNTTCKYFNS